ncbi:Oxysterol-binding protein [Xylariaceae sp. FL1019]|nr:Oxysterol-binding protein [Xylariaceae sp. FL1019]
MTKSQPSNISQLRDFLSYLTTVSGDLSNITAPPFVLSPKSVTEIPASWAERHELFLQPAREDDAAKRALLVLKNFLCSFKRQLYSSATDDGAKKPLNAFLGELFLGEFASADGSSTRLISEQVSHHPPVTACCLYNEKHGISSSGYVAEETTFSATSGVRVQQTGYAIIRDEVHQESHLRTLPTMVIKGLITGSPYPELEGICYISSSSGYLAKIEFEGKRTLGTGTKNSVRAELTNVREGGKKIFEISGQWNGTLVVKNCVSGEVVEKFDVGDVPLSELKVKDIDAQSPWESRRAWKGVKEAIRDGDMTAISREKNELEEAQRELRDAEAEVGIEWPRVFFRSSDDCQEFDLLAQIIPDPEVKNMDRSRTAGVWKFIGVDAAESLIKDGVFHEGLEPRGQVVGS